MIKHIKKGFLMAGILAVVLSLAGCPKEAGGSGGGSNSTLDSVKGTWISPKLNKTGGGEDLDGKVTISDSSITYDWVTSNSSVYESTLFTGSIEKILKQDSIVGIIGKNSDNKYKVFYIKNININSSFDLGMLNWGQTQNSLADAEDEFNVAYSLVNTYHTYLYQ